MPAAALALALHPYGQESETGEGLYDRRSASGAAIVEAARRPFGRIAIANSDAVANAMTESALSEAYRAVTELLP